MPGARISAQPFRVVKSRAPVPATESDSAVALTHRKTRRLGQALSTQLAQHVAFQQVASGKFVAANTAVAGTSVAQPFGKSKRHALVQAVDGAAIAEAMEAQHAEDELALPVAPFKGHFVDLTEANPNLALPLTVKQGSVGPKIILQNLASQAAATALPMTPLGPKPWRLPTRQTLLAAGKKIMVHWAGGTYSRGDNDAAFDAEIRDMVWAGFDAAIIDGFNWPGDLPNTTRSQWLADAAARHGGFSVIPMTDGAAGLPDATTMANRLATQMLLIKSACYKVPGSSPTTFVVAPWAPDVQGVVYWQQVVAAFLNNHALRVKLAPIFLNMPANLAPWAPLCHVIGVWGEATSSTVPGGYDTNANQVRAQGVGWAQPARIQDVRPFEGLWWESNNWDALRYTFDTALRTSADWVQFPTWNDVNEGTDMQFSNRHGYSFVDLVAYYGARYKTGQFPPIVRDGFFMSQRRHAWNATPTTAPPRSMTLVRGSPTDQIEFWVFATRSSTIALKVNGVTVATGSFAAGASVWKYPLPSSGTITATMNPVNDTATGFTVQSPPPTQDLQYLAVSSLR